MSKTAQRAKIPYERKNGTLHSFFALKFHKGDEDRAKVEAIEKALNKAGIEINRKVLADLAMNHPEAFKAIVAKAKAA